MLKLWPLVALIALALLDAVDTEHGVEILGLLGVENAQGLVEQSPHSSHFDFGFATMNVSNYGSLFLHLAQDKDAQVFIWDSFESSAPIFAHNFILGQVSKTLSLQGLDKGTRVLIAQDLDFDMPLLNQIIQGDFVPQSTIIKADQLPHVSNFAYFQIGKGPQEAQVETIQSPIEIEVLLAESPVWLL